MRARERSNWIRVLAVGTLVLSTLPNGFGQTQINLATQGRNVDFTNAPYTKPVKTGTSLPSSCAAGELFLNTSATAGQNLFACLSGSWTAMAASATGLSDPGSNGMVKRTGPNTTIAVPAPNGTIVGTSDVQTLTGKSIDASEINSGVLTPARIPALTGDVTTNAGSTATALSTVLTTPGTFGDATHALQMTVDSKGRVTSLNSLAINSGSNTNFYQQLAKAGTNTTPRATLNVSGAFNLTDNSGGQRTEMDLAQVNSNPGTFGGANQIPVITVNAYGQITGVTTTSAASTSSASNTTTSISAGSISSIPSGCGTGNLYFASDQPAGQQIYVCGTSNSWSQFMSLGASGALAFNGGALDIVTSVVPRLSATNSFTGSNTFSNGVTLASTNAQPTCSSSTRGLFWFQNNGSSKDSLQVCAFSGSAYVWASLY